MVYIVGAGPGAADLLTVRGLRLLQTADLVIYAGSLVNPELLKETKPGCQIKNSAVMTLEEVIAQVEEAEKKGLSTVRLHTGDPCLYGAVREQMDAFAARKIPFSICPGVSSFCGAAASLEMEYTLPSVSQSVIITRMQGRTDVPEKESIRAFAAHRATMVIFLSAGILKELETELMDGGYPADTPAAIVYKATWPEEKIVRCVLSRLAETGEREGIRKTALIIVGEAVAQKDYLRSKLYDSEFTTEFREGILKDTYMPSGSKEEILKDTYMPSGSKEEILKDTYMPSGSKEEILKDTYMPSGSKEEILKDTYMPSGSKEEILKDTCMPSGNKITG